ncbi:MAG: hypothetical protein OEN20_00245 [Gammaproteobacteria bacterium]|nr:hypothetical protein [Gammaproteobacteria bacterium]
MSPERGRPTQETSFLERDRREPRGFAFRVHGTEARVDKELALLEAKYRQEGMEVVVERVLSTMAVVIAPKSPWEVL